MTHIAFVVLLGLCCGSACSATQSERAPREAASWKPIPAETANGIGATLAPMFPRDLFSQGREAIVTGWEHTAERLDSRYCAQCHAAAHQAWSASLHARAWTDPIFQRAFASESQAWCKNCHAPLLAQQNGSLAFEQGVSCASCHVRTGQIVGTRHLVGSSTGHPVATIDRFANGDLCAGCHQFNFPKFGNAAFEYSDQPMQNTLVEWRAAGAQPCGECHTNSHAVSGPHDSAWSHELVTGATLSAPAPGVLSLLVKLRARAHSFPTGDNFHSFVLELATDSAFSSPIANRRFGRELGEGFSSAFEVTDRAVIRDSTLPAQSQGPSLSFDRPRAQALYARLRFFQHDSVLEGVNDADGDSAFTVWQQQFDLTREFSEE